MYHHPSPSAESDKTRIKFKLNVVMQHLRRVMLPNSMCRMSACQDALAFLMNVCSQVYRCVCVFPSAANTLDRWKRLGAHRGPISPVCSEGLFITTSKRVQYSTARQLHLLPFSLIPSLTPPEMRRSTATSHSAPRRTPVKPRLVASGSSRFQSCRCCRECFPSPSIFHLSCFWESK